tara:strand:- start:8414 stop:9982 length:1569 start_codon:yes stop_codon:yes gene_type:complete
LHKDIDLDISELLKKHNIKNITDDSRLVNSQSLFLAYKGINLDRRDFIENIINNKSLIDIIILKDIDNIEAHGNFDYIDKNQNIIIINYYDLYNQVGFIAKNFYNNIINDFNLTGVTGTNGKTSIVYLLTKCMQKLGMQAEFLGTLSNNYNAINTTPGAIQIQKILQDFKSQQVLNINMEASSHALSQNRLQCLEFNTVIFTNLSHDHLDYHKDLNDYFLAKSKLFDKPYIKQNTVIIINHDDKYGQELLEICIKNKIKNKIISYGSKAGFLVLQNSNINIDKLNLNYIIFDEYQVEKNKTLVNIELNIKLNIKQQISKSKYKLESKLMGKFNIYNLLAVIGVLLNNNFKIEDILSKLSEVGDIPGRMQAITSNHITAYVDYAHTPDALENILQEFAQFKKNNKIICVFGCGGDRDKLKRPKMGKIACKYADKVIVTDDNPRNEDARKIIVDIIKELSQDEQSKIIIEHDRALAIQKAIKLAKINDIIVIAGKGHEEYQIKGENKHYFSDYVTVKNLLNQGN